MADFSNTVPGVYIKEPAPSPPIAGVGTSTAGFVGRVKGAARLKDAPTLLPIQATSFDGFQGAFTAVPGGPTYDLSAPESRELNAAVKGFFVNGGTRCFIMPVAAVT